MDKLKEIAKKFGCGDSGCIFGNRGGQTTNGGCRCFKGNERIMKVRSGILSLRKLVGELELKIETDAMNAQPVMIKPPTSMFDFIKCPLCGKGGIGND